MMIQYVWKTVPFLVAATVLAAGSVLQGMWTDRWHTGAELESTVARLATIPLSFGQWEGTARDMDPRVLTLSGCHGYAIRRYVNRITGETISVTVMVGRPGPASVHTPEVCFTGGGYELSSPITDWTVPMPAPATSAVFRAASFRRADAGKSLLLRVLWSWSADGSWHAPDNPRVAFAGHLALCKLYVAREMLSEEESLQDDPCNGFVHDFLPYLNRVLIESPKP
jgi:hypothetical protein